MSTPVIIPALGESISSGILSSWKVEEGSYVQIDQPIYDLETDKITQEGLAEAAGIISFQAKEGDEVEIGSTVALIDESADEPKTPAVQKSNDKSEVVEAVAEAPPSQSTEAPEPVEASESLEPSTAENTESKH